MFVVGKGIGFIGMSLVLLLAVGVVGRLLLLIGEFGSGVGMFGKMSVLIDDPDGLVKGVGSSEGVNKGDRRGRKLKCRCCSVGTVSKEKLADGELRCLVNAARSSVLRDSGVWMELRSVRRVEGAIFDFETPSRWAPI